MRQVVDRSDDEAYFLLEMACQDAETPDHRNQPVKGVPLSWIIPILHSDCWEPAGHDCRHRWESRPVMASICRIALPGIRIEPWLSRVQELGCQSTPFPSNKGHQGEIIQLLPSGAYEQPFPYNLSPSHLKTFSAQTTKGSPFSQVVPHLEAPAAGERGSGGADGWMNCGWWKSLLHVHILLEVLAY
ncbi:hypothetical protein NQZ68_040527 [Dissostichus eleginoides]|nr:hypothetical protein NQZ68_040527 [Dissostichus eleginoides]